MYTLLFVYSYLILGVYLSFIQTYWKNLYLLALAFCSFKVITNYRICSVAYLECKMRNVKRKESYVNQFLDPIVDLRYTDHINPLTIFSFLILTYNVIFKEEYRFLINI